MRGERTVRARRRTPCGIASPRPTSSTTVGSSACRSAICQLALTHVGDRYGALDNQCPHQGGPLGEGSIEKGCFAARGTATTTTRSPGTPPPGFTDAPASLPGRGARRRRLRGHRRPSAAVRTVSDVMVETMVAWGVTHVFGMVGHSNLGFADAHAPPGGGRRPHVHRHPPRGRGRVRRVARTASSPDGRPPASASPVRDPPTCSPASTTPRSTARRCWPSRARCRRRCSAAAPSRTSTSPPRSPTSPVYSQTVLRRLRPRRADDAGAEARARRARRRASGAAGRGAGAARRPRRRRVGPAGRSPTTRSRRRPRRRPRRCALLGGARRPVIVVGHGARFDMAEVLALAEALRAPVLTTFKAKGLIPDRHPLGAGVLGRSGTPVASWLMNECDLLVVFGASFSNHTGIAPYKPIVQVDSDPDGARPLPPGDGPAARPCRASPAARCSPSGVDRRRRPRRPARRRRRALGDLAGREGAAGSPTTAGTGSARRRCSPR